MPATRYKIWAFGGQIGTGATHARHVGVAGIAKTNSQTMPYIIFNELVCAWLGRALFLPVPPSAVVEHDGEDYFVSLNFNIAGETLPPAPPDAIVEAQPELACGIVVFDAWIVNPDRHRRNLAFNRTTGKVQIFDHSHALFGMHGRAQLERAQGQLGIGGHCLVNHLKTLQHVGHWVDKIINIPEWYVRDLVMEASQFNVEQPDAEYCIRFLLDRREQLRNLFQQHRNMFTSAANELPFNI